MIEARRLRKEIKIIDGIDVRIEGSMLFIKSGNNEVRKKLSYPTINMKITDDKIVIEPKKFTKKEKKIINTFRAHILNMMKGARKQYEYKVEICSSHFPISVGIEKNIIVIKNFLGEKVPRKARILDDVEVKIEGNFIILRSSNKENVGQTAANCETATRITNRDRRKFQDGLWIAKKPERE